MKNPNPKTSNERWELTQTVFGEALKLPLEARTPFVIQSCGDRAEIMRDVLTLLASFDAAEEEFESLESLPRDLLREDQAASSSRKR